MPIRPAGNASRWHAPCITTVLEVLGFIYGVLVSEIKISKGLIMVKDFIAIIINPIWKWVVEIFMGLMSLIIYAKPEWTNWLSFSNLIQKYWLIWFVVGTIIWALATAWQYAKEKYEMRKTLESTKSNKPSESYYVKSGAVGKQEAREIKNYFSSEDKKKEKS